MCNDLGAQTASIWSTEEMEFLLSIWQVEEIVFTCLLMFFFCDSVIIKMKRKDLSISDRINFTTGVN